MTEKTILGFFAKLMLMFVGVFFRGAVAGSNTQEATDRVSVLKDEIKLLEDYEKLVDQHKSVRRMFMARPRALLTHWIRYISNL